jgi:hypothetical protein
MAKKIYPGNYVNNLASYADAAKSGQPTGVVAQPGRIFYHIVGYALVPFGQAAAVTALSITIPSPDRRPDDKPRADQTSMILPTGARLYQVGLRICDVRRDRGTGTALSNIVAVNTDRLKFADALANDNTLTTAAVSTPSASLVAASTTFAPGSAIISQVTPAILAGNETMQIFVTNSSGTAAGTAIWSREIGGTPLIVEAMYYVDDTEVPDINDVQIPFITESV